MIISIFPAIDLFKLVFKFEYTLKIIKNANAPTVKKGLWGYVIQPSFSRGTACKDTYNSKLNLKTSPEADIHIEQHAGKIHGFYITEAKKTIKIVGLQQVEKTEDGFIAVKNALI